MAEQTQPGTADMKTILRQLNSLSLSLVINAGMRLPAQVPLSIVLVAEME